MRLKRIGAPNNGQISTPGVNPKNFSSTASLQNYIRSQIYVKGYNINVAMGGNANIGDIVFGGQAKFLYGFVIYNSVVGFDTFSLTINNEVIVTDALQAAYDPRTNARGFDMYFPMPRPLTGADSVQFSYTADAAKAVYPVFYLSNFAPKE